MHELRGCPSRDPFTDACGRKALFRAVPGQSGRVHCLWFRVPDQLDGARADLKPFDVSAGVPSEILAPIGWRVAAVVITAGGVRWATPFAEVPHPSEVH